MQSGLVKF